MLKEHFSNDLKKFGTLKRERDLGLIIDEDELWRCGGRRIDNMNVSYDTCFPYLLSKESYFTKLVVIHSHETVKHNGVKETLNHIRRTFWITRSCNFVKKLIHWCFLCRYFEGQSYD